MNVLVKGSDDEWMPPVAPFIRALRFPFACNLTCMSSRASAPAWTWTRPPHPNQSYVRTGGGGHGRERRQGKQDAHRD